jgi:rhodanese-related sulfurtransferase
MQEDLTRRHAMQTINTLQLKALQEKYNDLLLVNTLPPESFDKTKIPGSVNIPQDRDDFVARVEQQAGGKDQKVVVYCASAQCNSSECAAMKLDSAGFTSVLDYQGGAEAWHSASASTLEQATTQRA